MLGISVDSVWTHMAFAKQMGLKYPLLADFQPRGDVASKYGLYLADKGITARATVIVDKKGKVAWVKQEEIPAGARQQGHPRGACQARVGRALEPRLPSFWSRRARRALLCSMAVHVARRAADGDRSASWPRTGPGAGAGRPRRRRAPRQTAPAPAPAPAPTDSTAPAASSAPSVVPATGYGWSTTPPKHHGVAPARAGATGAAGAPDAILPGFETLADGSTRLFVQLHQAGHVRRAKAAQGTLTYVLKGAHVDKRNNFNPLVTVHFNTPVTSARLVPHGSDLWFVVDLRAQRDADGDDGRDEGRRRDAPHRVPQGRLPAAADGSPAARRRAPPTPAPAASAPRPPSPAA